MINTNDTTISAFARLLATENIVVRHANDAHTASFDMVERILTLPRWKGMTPALYDMLVGHEVAHALWTDATIDEETGNLAACVDIAPDNPRAILPILNIVEDARIERLIKSKYPGLKRDFVSGYKTIHDMGIFELEGRPIDKMSFLDRLNMEFKLGILGYLNVPFTDSTEIWFRDRIAASQTWDDVVEITRDLYEYDKQKQEEEEKEEDQENMTDSNLQVSGMSSDEEEVDGDSEEGSSQSNDTDGEGDDSAGSSASPGDDDDDSDGSVTSKGAAASEYTPDVSTQDAMDDAMVAEKSEWMPRDKGIERMPTPILKEMIVSPEHIRESHINAKCKYSSATSAARDSRLKTIAQHFAKCDEYMLNEKSSVNYLSKQFEMRKAADIHKRTMTSKTGRLDPVKMINYRWSEDIFAKNQTVRDGKNHGFVCVLDWSGSMSDNLLATVRQAITLAMFCRRTGLPFELYAFSDRLAWDAHSTGDATQNPETWSKDNYTTGTTKDDRTWKTSTLNDLKMLNFLSAKMNTREFTEACRVLYSVALCEASRAYATWTSPELALGGTPLDESIIALHTMLPAFQRKHNVQVLNAVILTDGDGRNTFDNAIIVNPITKRSYGSHPTENGLKSTYLLLKSLKETTGCNLIGMYLSTANKCTNVGAAWFDRWDASDEEMKSVQKQWKQANYYVATGKYADFFDEAYIINANTNPETEINLPDSATQAHLRNAFVKGMKSRGMSRNLSNRFIEVVAR